jgi:hypothetical protein
MKFPLRRHLSMLHTISVAVVFLILAQSAFLMLIKDHPFIQEVSLLKHLESHG